MPAIPGKLAVQGSQLAPAQSCRVALQLEQLGFEANALLSDGRKLLSQFGSSLRGGLGCGLLILQCVNLLLQSPI